MLFSTSSLHEKFFLVCWLSVFVLPVYGEEADAISEQQTVLESSAAAEDLEVTDDTASDTTSDDQAVAPDSDPPTTEDDPLASDSADEAQALAEEDIATDQAVEPSETDGALLAEDDLLEDDLGDLQTELGEDDLGEDALPAGADRPSARGVGGVKKDAPPAQAIETESVDTSEAEAVAERQQRLAEEEIEIQAQQKELERRQRIERGLDEQIQDLKEEALLLGQELRLLSEKLIYPSSTQVTVFLSLKESDEDYLLDSINLKVNGKLVGSHLYTLREIDALRKGGVQRIFDGNLRSGEHSLELTVNGREDDELSTLDWQYDFSKGSNPHFVELKIYQDRITASSW